MAFKKILIQDVENTSIITNTNIKTNVIMLHKEEPPNMSKDIKKLTAELKATVLGVGKLDVEHTKDAVKILNDFIKQLNGKYEANNTLKVEKAQPKDTNRPGPKRS